MADIYFDEKHFLTSDPNLTENEDLREPQIEAYYKAFNHFIKYNKTSHAIIVLPTGVGKTGLMGILPYHISEGRVLIITPGTTIRDSVVDSLNPKNPENFWLKRKVFNQVDELPTLIEYEGDKTPNEILENANIVVLNIHKLQERLESSLINRLNADFFDMILIDEAHHSTADTWVEATNYFLAEKVVKLTGTPFRSDGKPIVGDEIFRYKLSAAMANGYVKSLEDLVHIPEELHLTVDNDSSEVYTVEEIYEMGIKDENWVSRSVAYSKECSQKEVNRSIEQLEEKAKYSDLPHKIIAVACSIEHAEQIKALYEQMEYTATIIHSKLKEEELQMAYKNIENDRTQVVVNVAMLGEGYDHKYLSVAALFRPFRSRLPYAQFVGRILRRIPDSEAQSAQDNVGVIVSHEHLYLRDLWNYYKKEIQESNTIRLLDELEKSEIDLGFEGESNRDYSIGKATEKGEGETIIDSYITTELIEKQREEKAKRKQAIIELQNLLEIKKEEAVKIYDQNQSKKSKIKRPDQYFKDQKNKIDNLIRYEIVPEIISDFKLDASDNDIKNSKLFEGEFSWIKKINSNAGMLATYFNNALKMKIDKKRKDWKLADYEHAFEKVKPIREYVENVLKNYLSPGDEKNEKRY
ncbi:DEAD/DEAH box helicase [Halanaerobium sp.]|uniref:DEAD/DEAH box helicase n=1 Tax=Halanaerobium sp. TaxID=1895664 RepID=UPI000DE710C2|nr:DEAD/DEAH box helicase family protein [Halanaerobium sp.]PUU88711.1 MAG: type III restriction protein res subunit [Halanaerobium sp.]